MEPVVQMAIRARPEQHAAENSVCLLMPNVAKGSGGAKRSVFRSPKEVVTNTYAKTSLVVRISECFKLVE